MFVSKLAIGSSDNAGFPLPDQLCNSRSRSARQKIKRISVVSKGEEVKLNLL